MKSDDRVLGELKEFKRATIAELKRQRLEISKVHAKLDSFEKFKTKVVTVSGLITFFFLSLKEWLHK